MKTLTYIAALLFSLTPFDAQEAVPCISMPQTTMTVVLDAGHGGKDSGSLGANSQEKNIALSITLKVGEYINQYLPDVEVVYTREDDTFVPLDERAQVANDNKADVFISIHCNSLPKAKKHINGTETYVMGLHTAEENLAVAKRENEVILLEDNYKQKYGGYDPNSTEGHIMLSMYQNAHLSQSILLAEKVEEQFKTKAKRNSRGVKQAGFVVLKASAMPSVLIETGFLSNSSEEQYLSSESGQVYIASAIYRAFKEYKNSIGTPSSNYASRPSTPSTPPTIDNNNTVLRVQLASSSNALNTNNGRWAKVSNLQEYKVDGLYKYSVGDFTSWDAAVAKQNYWRKNGFSDAFIVAYKNGQRISLDEARKIIK